MAQVVTGILTEGFWNTKKGRFGEKVCITDCSFAARDYCVRKAQDGCDCIFVNEVLDSDSLQTFRHGKHHQMHDHNPKPEHPFEKHVFKGSQQLTEADYKQMLLEEGKNISQYFNLRFD